MVGDGEVETGALATSWHSNKFIDPVNDGVVLPILHLNGYKIANPTVLARIPEDELRSLMTGYGHKPYFFEVPDRQIAADAADAIAGSPHCSTPCSTGSRRSKATQRPTATLERPRWPMIVLLTPKGWTGPEYIDGKKTTGSWRAHQVPLTAPGTTPSTAGAAEWMASYRADELFDEDGRLDPEDRRAGAEG